MLDVTTFLPVALVAVAIGAWLLVPYAFRRYSEVRLASICRKRRAIVLSYDDGPGQVLTHELLDLLGCEGVKATFFMVGRNADSQPETVRRVIREGHDAGSHTYDHLNAWRAMPWIAGKDVAKGIETIDKHGGSGRFFRPPYGKLTIAGLVQGRLRRIRYGWWTVDSRDSWARRPIPEVLQELCRRGGGVVLMHDADRYDPAQTGTPHRSHVLDLTRSIIDLARAERMRLLKLSDLDHPRGIAEPTDSRPTLLAAASMGSQSMETAPRGAGARNVSRLPVSAFADNDLCGQFERLNALTPGIDGGGRRA